jgi:hypothetical protein
MITGYKLPNKSANGWDKMDRINVRFVRISVIHQPLVRVSKPALPRPPNETVNIPDFAPTHNRPIGHADAANEAVVNGFFGIVVDMIGRGSRVAQ